MMTQPSCRRPPPSQLPTPGVRSNRQTRLPGSPDDDPTRTGAESGAVLEDPQDVPTEDGWGQLQARAMLTAPFRDGAVVGVL